MGSRLAICGLLFLAATTSIVRASVLEVGPIALTGSGTFFGPDWAPYGGEGIGGQGVIFSASGSNGADSVSITTRDIEVDLTPLSKPLFTPSVPCVYRFVIASPLCDVTIDGITGYGNFTRIGGGSGLLQVFAVEPGSWENGPLLAEAQIISYVHLTGVTAWKDPTRPTQEYGFRTTFDISTHNPEPATMLLVFVGLLCIVWRYRVTKPTNRT